MQLSNARAHTLFCSFKAKRVVAYLSTLSFSYNDVVYENTFECLLLAEIFQAMSSVWSYFSKVFDAGNNNEAAQCKFCSK